MRPMIGHYVWIFQYRGSKIIRSPAIKKAPPKRGHFHCLPACYFLAGGVAGTARVAGVALVAAPPLFGVALVAGTAGVAFVAGGVAAVTAKVAAANTTAVRTSSGLVMYVLLNGWRHGPPAGRQRKDYACACETLYFSVQ